MSFLEFLENSIPPENEKKVDFEFISDNDLIEKNNEKLDFRIFWEKTLKSATIHVILSKCRIIYQPTRSDAV